MTWVAQVAGVLVNVLASEGERHDVVDHGSQADHVLIEAAFA